MTETTEERIQRNKDWLHRRGIRLPTLQQMRDPSLIPDDVKKQLKDIALQDVSPLNLYRISWKNEPVAKGGGFAGVNHMILPPSLTGVPCHIVVLIGAHFPTGAHKVGATYCTLADKITSGILDPLRHKVLWPSTGNYCRGGVYDCQLLECPAIAVLPEDMSQERFDWLKAHDAQIEPTPGGESNVKEIFDHVKHMTASDDSILVCNQFAEFGNPMWHYAVTGPAMKEVFESLPGDSHRLSGVFSCTGSAGTIACGDYLKHQFPGIKVAAGEALQCPTLTYGGYGEHRIEGIGDKIIPWVHNIRNLDVACALDDEHVMRIYRLFNTDAGKRALAAHGVPADIISQLHYFGISGVANMLGAIKMAKYFEYCEQDVIVTVATDSSAMYQSRMDAMEKEHGVQTDAQAVSDMNTYLLGCNIEHVKELSYWDKKRIHHLKYFTWVEQQGKTMKELDKQWYDYEDYWNKAIGMESANALDARIAKFHE